MERAKYFVLHGRQVWNDKRVSKWWQYFIFWSTIPLIRASKQNHITTVIYWNMLDSCVKTGRAIEYLEYFMLSCSTLCFLLRNSTDAQLCCPSVVQRSKWAGGDVIISQRSKCEEQSNRGSLASLQAGKLQQEERVSYARAERFGHSTLPRVSRVEADADKSSIPFFLSHTTSWSPELWVRLFLCCSSKHI